MKNIFKEIGVILLIVLFLLLCFSSKWFNSSTKLDDETIDEENIENNNSDENVVKEYSYSNNIDVSKITESDLRKVIDKELFLLLGEKNFRYLSDQEKLRMLIKIYIENGGDKALTYTPFSVKDLMIIHENSTLNNLSVEYKDINAFGRGGLIETNEIGYKFDKVNQTYTNLIGRGDLNIVAYPKLVDFRQEDNKYLVSYNYLFSTTHGDGPSDITLHKNISDALEIKNEIKRISSEEVINNKIYDFNEYLSNNNEHDKYKEELYIYNYVFEVINGKLTLIDFYLSNNNMSCSYDNKIDVNNIKQEDLDNVIDNELFLLVKKNKLSELTNQEKLVMLYNTMYWRNMCNYSSSEFDYFKIDDFKNIHNNSTLNSLDIKYADINDSYSQGLGISNEVWYKVDNFTNRYVYVGYGHGAGPYISVYKNLVNYKQEENKYYLSYKYLFGNGGEGPNDISLYKNVDDALNRKNELKTFSIEKHNYDTAALKKEIELYVNDNFESLDNGLYTYNYVFEVINGKLTLTDYYRN